MHAATIQTGHDMLERDLKAMKDNYDKTCSENQQLNAPFTRQQKDKEKRRAREEALKEARDKARGDDKTCNLNSTLTTNEKSVRHIVGTF